MGRLTGRGFLEQMAEFLAELNDMFGGFKERAARVAAAFRAPEFAYALVTAPLPAALEEAHYFRARLEQLGMRADAIIVNRVHAEPAQPPALEDAAASVREQQLSLDEGGAQRMLTAALDEMKEASLEAQELSRSGLLSAGSARLLVKVPVMAGDVHDLRGLARVSRSMFSA
jgi:anion-transporting  ArsA/GET3 family ATPase